MDKTMLKKIEFVHKYLFPLVHAADDSVTDLEYMRHHDNEFVIIKYRSGTQTPVSISRDSLVMLARDVLKYI